jgi:hypothetical protein
MTAQTPYERLKAYRQRKAEAGEVEVRGIFAPKELHAKIKEEAKKITKRP